MGSCRFTATLSCFLVTLITCSDALRFEVTAYSKCIGEEIQEGVLVLGDYSVVDGDQPPHERITVKVTSPHGVNLHWKEQVESGQFGFTTKEEGQYMACFWIPHAMPGVQKAKVDLDWKKGVAAQDWASVAKKDKLDTIGLELRKLEEAVSDIRDEMNYFSNREEDLRHLNEVANARVAWLGGLSLIVCLGLAALQMWSLKAYFERKKLL
eukprot:TRINITY_DN37181_c0_g1_i1.p1 TRINITY_DN37181_c0_g1~~TRINITY_DN37181_c0_g1_i1.p1  ORF type:complete len:210 (-),score=34.39 TRINITY_DN37181_c0_g1_i1:198-827(-)